MDGVAQMAHQKGPASNHSAISYHSEESSPFSSYDATIPVMETSGQDVLELEMNHDGEYLDTREFGRADYQGPTAGYSDQFTESPYDQMESGPSYENNASFDPAPEQQQQQEEAPPPPPAETPQISIQVGETPIDHKSYSQPPSVELRLVASPGHPMPTVTVGAPPRPPTMYAVKTIPTEKVYTFSRNMGGSRRSGSRNHAKKEPLDPNMVEEEVARNVSQILSLTKQHRAAMEANARPGPIHIPPQQQRTTPPPVINRVVYTCPDCNKQVSSTRNLARHRQSCPATRKFPLPQPLQLPQQQAHCSQPTTPSGLIPSSPSIAAGVVPNMAAVSSVNPQPVTLYVRREEPGYPEWCSPRSSSVSTASSIRDTVSHPPSRDEGSVTVVHTPSHELSFADHLEPHMGHHHDMGYSYHSNGLLDDSQGFPMSMDDERPPSDEMGSGDSGSASRCSDTNGSIGQFQCEACQKSVASLRSLKRHHTTCKPFAQQFPHVLEQENSGSNLANTTCPDCSRQLCSTSNLKRHRATCKAGGNSTDDMTPTSEAGSPAKPNFLECPDRRFVVVQGGANPELEGKFIQVTVGDHLKAQQQAGQQLQRFEPGIQIVQQGMQLGAQPLQQTPPNGHHLPNVIPAHIQQNMQRNLSEGDLPPRSAPPHMTNGPQFPAPIQRSHSTNNYQHYVQPYVNGPSAGHLAMNGHDVLDVGGGKLEEEMSDGPHGPDFEVDEHYGYGFNSATDVSDLDDDLKEKREGEFDPTVNLINGHTFVPNLHHTTPVQSANNNTTLSQQQNSALRAALDTSSPPPRHTVSSHPLPATSFPTTRTSMQPLNSIITTQPLPSDRIVFSSPQSARSENTYYVSHIDAPERHQQTSYSIHQPTQQSSQQHHQQAQFSPQFSPNLQHQLSPGGNRELQAVAATAGREVDLRFQCPECLKTYSCRKNVKRHRMAVHKLTPEEISRTMGSGSATTDFSASSTPSLQSPSGMLLTTSSMMNSPIPSNSQKPWGAQLSPQIKRFQEPRIMTEFAEADTTFSEDAEDPKDEHAGLLDMGMRRVDRRGSQVSPGFPKTMGQRVEPKKTTHQCIHCQKVLSSDYSLRRHRHTCTKILEAQRSISVESEDPMIGQGPRLGTDASRHYFKPIRRPQSTDGGLILDEETIPDSTTQRSSGFDSMVHSPSNMSSPSESGEHHHHLHHHHQPHHLLGPRKRRHSASELSAPVTRHLCQDPENLLQVVVPPGVEATTNYNLPPSHLVDLDQPLF
ncbi:unnamed protein product, partial [Mesorhabditis spiculigera]